MTTVVSALILIVCLLLIVVVLIQNSKGGGLSSSFGSGNQVMGVRKTTDFLEKATWGLAIALLVLSLFSASLTGGVNDEALQNDSKIKDLVNSSAVTPPAGLEGQPASQPAPAPAE